MQMSLLEQQLEALPGSPGVYLFKDSAENIIYVGKASSLYHRVNSYFGPLHNLSLKTQRLVSRISDLDFIVTDSEQEAILLECHLIKKHYPHYNVRLKDDKSFPYLKIDFSESWPRIYVTRRVDKDKARYFGPFASPGSVRKTLNMLRRLFPLRTCKKAITGSEQRACLEYHIHRCLGPCIGAVSREDYQQVINQVILFLEGKQEAIVQDLRNKMQAAAENLEFEKAALLRDQINAVERVIERQKVTSAEGEMDVVAFARSNDQAYVLVFSIRNGKLMGRENFILEGTRDEEPSRIMTSFVEQFYNSTPYIPEKILLQHPIDEMPAVKKWLEGKKQAKVEIQVPRRGTKKQLVDMVAGNARQGFEQYRVKLLAEADSLAAALEDLQKELFLPRPPRRIECYDISNIQGTSAVGSMVVFDKGSPKKSHYRRFKIKSVAGANDYAMIGEVLRRRFKKGTSEPEGSPWGITPDLVLIDGGRGQLNAALEAMKEAGADSVPCAGIAKENESLFLPQLSDPILLPSTSGALHLLQRVRDEAHRFALGYHHKVHRKETFASALDSVPGIGVQRKRALIQRFGSIKNISQATVEELTEVKGITPAIAGRLKTYL